ncbi:MAG: VOC family protein [Paracoccaceae bacterium]
MLNQINGLHHVTSIASGANENNAFFTRVLGLRRVKKTVNFDAPDVYHLYYGDAAGSPGSVMTYFPFPHARRGRPGAGEVSQTAFAVPLGATDWWAERLATFGVENIEKQTRFGETRLRFNGPDGDGFSLVEVDDPRAPWLSQGVDDDHAIRGFHSAEMRLNDPSATAELLQFMGYQQLGQDDDITRFIRDGGNGAHLIDLETLPDAPQSNQGAGSVHHIAFSVDNRATQEQVRKALLDTGYQVTPVIDRDYFWAIYFRTPAGVLFEIATNEPGFDRDEPAGHLGESLMLPDRHAHLRPQLEQLLEPITD